MNLAENKITEYKDFLAERISERPLIDSILSGNQAGLEEAFWDLSILEAQALRSKMNSLTQDYSKAVTDTFGMIFLKNLQQADPLLQGVYTVIDSYNVLLSTLLRDVEKNRPRFYDVFFPDKVEEVRNLIFQLYPQTMPVSHYKEVFDLCGYAPFEGNDNITQLTMRRLQTFLSYKVITKKVEIFDNYTLSELSGIVREDRIRDIVDSFWSTGRLDNLELIANENGGKLILDGRKVKIFEAEYKEKDGSSTLSLVYATPSFYSYNPGNIFNKKKGDYLFLDREPRMSTCLIEIDQVLLRQDFLKPPADTDETKFNIRIQVPVNLFKFYVKKV